MGNFKTKQLKSSCSLKLSSPLPSLLQSKLESSTTSEVFIKPHQALEHSSTPSQPLEASHTLSQPLEVNQTSQPEKESITSLKQSKRSARLLEVIPLQLNKRRRLLVPFNRLVLLLASTRSLTSFMILKISDTQSMRLLTSMKLSAKLVVLLRLFQ